MAKRGLDTRQYMIVCIAITILIILFSIFLDSIFPLPSEDELFPSMVPLGNSGKDALYRDTDIPNGTVAITEFSDFECPFCREAQPVLKRIKENYGDKVQIIFRHFPTGHTFSQSAAEASECAADQGMFWEYHDKLFDSQVGSVKDLVDYAGLMGMNVTEFSDCLMSRKKQSIVDKDAALGTSLGVPGTPTFYVGDQQILGIPVYSEITSMIDSQLKGEVKDEN